LRKSLTWDRGSEIAGHKRFTLDTAIQVDFYDPQSPWQRGSDEYTNGLPRQSLPKGMDLSNVHQNRLNAVARRHEASFKLLMTFAGSSIPWVGSGLFSRCTECTGNLAALPAPRGLAEARLGTHLF
jgi:hypothetical protein